LRKSAREPSGFLDLRFQMMLAVAFMAVLLAVSPLVPGVKWLEPGDFSSTAEVVYYHTVMFELVMLGLLTVSYVVGLPKRLSLAVSASNVPIMVLSVLGVGLSYPAWASTANNVVQGLRDFWLFVLSLAVLIGLLASPFHRQGGQITGQGRLECLCPPGSVDGLSFDSGLHGPYSRLG